MAYGSSYRSRPVSRRGRVRGYSWSSSGYYNRQGGGYGGFRSYGGFFRRGSNYTRGRRVVGRRKTTGRVRPGRSAASVSKQKPKTVFSRGELQELKKLKLDVRHGRELVIPACRGLPKSLTMYHGGEDRRYYFIFPVNEYLAEALSYPLQALKKSEGMSPGIGPTYLSSVTLTHGVSRNKSVELTCQLVKIPPEMGGESLPTYAVGSKVDNNDILQYHMFNLLGHAEETKAMVPRHSDDPEVLAIAQVAFTGLGDEEKPYFQAPLRKGACLKGTYKVGNAQERQHKGSVNVTLDGPGLEQQVDTDMRYSWPVKATTQVCDAGGRLVGDRYAILFGMKAQAAVEANDLLTDRNGAYAMLRKVQVKCCIRYGRVI